MNRKIFYAITAAVFFIFALTSLGGCGGGHSSSFSGNTGNGNGNNSNPTQDVSELDGKTFASSATNLYSGKAVDNDGNEYDVSLYRFITSFSNVSSATASGISASALTGSADVSYIFEVGASVDRYAYSFNTVELTTESDGYKFSFNDVDVTVNPSSKNITVDGAFYVDGTLFTLTEPINMAVTEKTDEHPTGVPRYVLMGGEFAYTNEYSGDLTPFIDSRITERVYTTDMENVITTIESLRKGDILFLTDASDTFPEDATFLDIFRIMTSLADAFDQGVSFVSVHATSGDVSGMNLILSLSLENPDDDAPYPFFEILGIAKRPLSNGNSHIFNYTATCTANQDYFDSFNLTSGDSVSYTDENAGTSVDIDIDDTSGVDPEEFYKTVCETRVQALFDWANGLDEQAAELDESVSASVAKFKTSAGLGDELMSIATGMTTYVDDHFSMSDYDYYVKYMKDDPSAANVIREIRIVTQPELSYTLAHNFITRDTHTDYRVISLHSFDTHKDYYLVTSKINTQPKGINTGANTQSLYGYTRRVISWIWPNVYGNHLERYLPDQTVNRSRSYTDSSGWSVTNATTISNTISAKIGFSGEDPTGEIGGSTTVSYTNSKTASHNSSTTWTVDDYEIIPMPFTNEHSTRYAKWRLDVAWPSYKYSGNPYTLSNAARTSVTLDTEAIFSAELSEAEKFKIYANAGWNEAISAYGYGWSHQHSGEIKTLNMVRPLHTAVTAAAYDGNRENKQYLGVFNAEASWTAESNVDWLELAYADPSNPQVGRKVSGSSGGTGIRINYQAQENNTGRMRIGVITIKSGKDKVYIPFTQSAAGIN